MKEMDTESSGPSSSKNLRDGGPRSVLNTSEQEPAKSGYMSASMNLVKREESKSRIKCDSTNLSTMSPFEETNTATSDKSIIPSRSVGDLRSNNNNSVSTLRNAPIDHKLHTARVETRPDELPKRRNSVTGIVLSSGTNEPCSTVGSSATKSCLTGIDSVQVSIRVPSLTVAKPPQSSSLKEMFGQNTPNTAIFDSQRTQYNQEFDIKSGGYTGIKIESSPSPLCLKETLGSIRKDQPSASGSQIKRPFSKLSHKPKSKIEDIVQNLRVQKSLKANNLIKPDKDICFKTPCCSERTAREILDQSITGKTNHDCMLEKGKCVGVSCDNGNVSKDCDRVKEIEGKNTTSNSVPVVSSGECSSRTFPNDSACDNKVSSGVNSGLGDPCNVTKEASQSLVKVSDVSLTKSELTSVPDDTSSPSKEATKQKNPDEKLNEDKQQPQTTTKDDGSKDCDDGVVVFSRSVNQGSISKEVAKSTLEDSGKSTHISTPTYAEDQSDSVNSDTLPEDGAIEQIVRKCLNDLCVNTVSLFDEDSLLISENSVKNSSILDTGSEVSSSNCISKLCVNDSDTAPMFSKSTVNLNGQLSVCDPCESAAVEMPPLSCSEQTDQSSKVSIDEKVVDISNKEVSTTKSGSKVLDCDSIEDIISIPKSNSESAIKLCDISVTCNQQVSVESPGSSSGSQPKTCITEVLHSAGNEKFIPDTKLVTEDTTNHKVPDSTSIPQVLPKVQQQSSISLFPDYLEDISSESDFDDYKSDDEINEGDAKKDDKLQKTKSSEELDTPTNVKDKVMCTKSEKCDSSVEGFDNMIIKPSIDELKTSEFDKTSNNKADRLVKASDSEVAKVYETSGAKTICQASSISRESLNEDNDNTEDDSEESRVKCVKLLKELVAMVDEGNSKVANRRDSSSSTSSQPLSPLPCLPCRLPLAKVSEALESCTKMPKRTCEIISTSPPLSKDCVLKSINDLPNESKTVNTLNSSFETDIKTESFETTSILENSSRNSAHSKTSVTPVVSSETVQISLASCQTSHVSVDSCKSMDNVKESTSITSTNNSSETANPFTMSSKSIDIIKNSSETMDNLPDEFESIITLTDVSETAGTPTHIMESSKGTTNASDVEESSTDLSNPETVNEITTDSPNKVDPSTSSETMDTLINPSESTLCSADICSTNAVDTNMSLTVHALTGLSKTESANSTTDASESTESSLDENPTTSEATNISKDSLPTDIDASVDSLEPVNSSSPKRDPDSRPANKERRPSTLSITSIAPNIDNMNHGSPTKLTTPLEICDISPDTKAVVPPEENCSNILPEASATSTVGSCNLNSAQPPGKPSKTPSSRSCLVSPSNKFLFQIELVHQMKLNDGQKLFACDICSGVYQRAFSLKRHYLRSHINYRYLTERDISNCGIVTGDKMAVQSGNNTKICMQNSKITAVPGNVSVENVCVIGGTESNEVKSTENTVINSEEESGVCKTDLKLSRHQTETGSNQIQEKTTEDNVGESTNEKSSAIKQNDSSAEKKPKDNDGKDESRNILGLFRCHTCGNCFEEKSELKTHLMNHPVPSALGPSVEGKPYTCTKCNATFSHKHNYLRHCASQAHNNQALIVAGDNKKVYLCLYCNKDFTSVAIRKRHQSRIHQNQKKLKRRKRQQHLCPFCIKPFAKFRELSDLVQHLSSIHTDVYHFCSVCEERFENKNVLDEHLERGHIKVKSKLLKSNRVVNDVTCTGAKSSENASKEENSANICSLSTNTRVLHKEDGAKGTGLPRKEPLVENGRSIGLKIGEGVNAEQQQGSEEINFRYACGICHKMFTNYVNMCRHNRLAHGRTPSGSKKSKHSSRSSSCTDTLSTTSSGSRSQSPLDASFIPVGTKKSSPRRSQPSPHLVQSQAIGRLEANLDERLMDPETLFYSRLSCNIRDNLLNHLDGKLHSQNNIQQSEDSISSNVDVDSREESSSQDSNIISELSSPTNTQMSNQEETLTNTRIEDTEKSAKNMDKIGGSSAHKVFWEKYNFPKNYDGKGGGLTSYIKDMSHLDIHTQLTMRQNLQRMNSNSSDSSEDVPLSNMLRDENQSRRVIDFPAELRLVENVNSSNRKRSIEESQNSKTNIPAQTKESKPVEEGRRITRRKSEMEQRERDAALERDASAAKSNSSSRRSSTEDCDNGSPVLSGEWVRPRSYICAACSERFADLWDLEDHKYSLHPNVWCTHYEFDETAVFGASNSEDRTSLSVRALPVDLCRRYLLANGSLQTAQAIPPTIASESKCTKCGRSFHTLSELHRHMLECGGDTTWMLTMLVASPGAGRRNRKWRPFGSRRRRQQGRRGMKRNIPNTPVKIPHYRPRHRAGDIDSIQRMIANLPAKRSTRRVIQFSEDEIKTRSQATIHSVSFAPTFTRPTYKTASGRSAYSRTSSPSGNSELLSKRDRRRILKKKAAATASVSGSSQGAVSKKFVRPSSGTGVEGAVTRAQVNSSNVLETLELAAVPASSSKAVPPKKSNASDNLSTNVKEKQQSSQENSKVSKTPVSPTKKSSSKMTSGNSSLTASPLTVIDDSNAVSVGKTPAVGRGRSIKRLPGVSEVRSSSIGPDTNIDRVTRNVKRSLSLDQKKINKKPTVSPADSPITVLPSLETQEVTVKKKTVKNRNPKYKVKDTPDPSVPSTPVLEVSATVKNRNPKNKVKDIPDPSVPSTPVLEVSATVKNRNPKNKVKDMPDSSVPSTPVLEVSVSDRKIDELAADGDGIKETSDILAAMKLAMLESTKTSEIDEDGDNGGRSSSLGKRTRSSKLTAETDETTVLKTKRKLKQSQLDLEEKFLRNKGFVHPDDSTGEPIICDSCGIQFDNGSACERHRKKCIYQKTMDVKTSSNEDEIREDQLCHHCGKSFSYTATFWKHIKTCSAIVGVNNLEKSPKKLAHDKQSENITKTDVSKETSQTSPKRNDSSSSSKKKPSKLVAPNVPISPAGSDVDDKMPELEKVEPIEDVKRVTRSKRSEDLTDIPILSPVSEVGAIATELQVPDEDIFVSELQSVTSTPDKKCKKKKKTKLISESNVKENDITAFEALHTHEELPKEMATEIEEEQVEDPEQTETRGRSRTKSNINISVADKKIHKGVRKESPKKRHRSLKGTGEYAIPISKLEAQFAEVVNIIDDSQEPSSRIVNEDDDSEVAAIVVSRRVRNKGKNSVTSVENFEAIGTIIENNAMPPEPINIEQPVVQLNTRKKKSLNKGLNLINLDHNSELESKSKELVYDESSTSKIDNKTKSVLDEKKKRKNQTKQLDQETYEMNTSEDVDHAPNFNETLSKDVSNNEALVKSSIKNKYKRSRSRTKSAKFLDLETVETNIMPRSSDSSQEREIEKDNVWERKTRNRSSSKVTKSELEVGNIESTVQNRDEPNDLQEKKKKNGSQKAIKSDVEISSDGLQNSECTQVEELSEQIITESSDDELLVVSIREMRKRSKSQAKKVELETSHVTSETPQSEEMNKSVHISEPVHDAVKSSERLKQKRSRSQTKLSNTESDISGLILECLDRNQMEESLEDLANNSVQDKRTRSRSQTKAATSEIAVQSSEKLSKSPQNKGSFLDLVNIIVTPEKRRSSSRLTASNSDSDISNMTPQYLEHNDDTSQASELLEELPISDVRETRKRNRSLVRVTDSELNLSNAVLPSLERTESISETSQKENEIGLINNTVIEKKTRRRSQTKVSKSELVSFQSLEQTEDGSLAVESRELDEQYLMNSNVKEKKKRSRSETNASFSALDNSFVEPKSLKVKPIEDCSKSLEDLMSSNKREKKQKNKKEMKFVSCELDTPDTVSQSLENIQIEEFKKSLQDLNDGKQEKLLRSRSQTKAAMSESETSLVNSLVQTSSEELNEDINRSPQDKKKKILRSQTKLINSDLESSYEVSQSSEDLHTDCDSLIYSSLEDIVIPEKRRSRCRTKIVKSELHQGEYLKPEVLGEFCENKSVNSNAKKKRRNKIGMEVNSELETLTIPSSEYTDELVSAIQPTELNDGILNSSVAEKKKRVKGLTKRSESEMSALDMIVLQCSEELNASFKTKELVDSLVNTNIQERKKRNKNKIKSPKFVQETQQTKMETQNSEPNISYEITDSFIEDNVNIRCKKKLSKNKTIELQSELKEMNTELLLVELSQPKEMPDSNIDRREKKKKSKAAKLELELQDPNVVPDSLKYDQNLIDISQTSEDLKNCFSNEILPEKKKKIKNQRKSIKPKEIIITSENLNPTDSTNEIVETVYIDKEDLINSNGNERRKSKSQIKLAKLDHQSSEPNQTIVLTEINQVNKNVTEDLKHEDIVGSEIIETSGHETSETSEILQLAECSNSMNVSEPGGTKSISEDLLAKGPQEEHNTEFKADKKKKKHKSKKPASDMSMSEAIEAVVQGSCTDDSIIEVNEDISEPIISDGEISNKKRKLKKSKTQCLTMTADYESDTISKILEPSIDLENSVCSLNETQLDLEPADREGSLLPDSKIVQPIKIKHGKNFFKKESVQPIIVQSTDNSTKKRRRHSSKAFATDAVNIYDEKHRIVEEICTSTPREEQNIKTSNTEPNFDSSSCTKSIINASSVTEIVKQQENTVDSKIDSILNHSKKNKLKKKHKVLSDNITNEPNTDEKTDKELIIGKETEYISSEDQSLLDSLDNEYNDVLVDEDTLPISKLRDPIFMKYFRMRKEVWETKKRMILENNTNEQITSSVDLVCNTDMQESEQPLQQSISEPVYSSVENNISELVNEEETRKENEETNNKDDTGGLSTRTSRRGRKKEDVASPIIGRERSARITRWNLSYEEMYTSSDVASETDSQEFETTPPLESLDDVISEPVKKLLPLRNCRLSGKRGKKSHIGKTKNLKLRWASSKYKKMSAKKKKGLGNKNVSNVLQSDNQVSFSNEKDSEVEKLISETNTEVDSTDGLQLQEANKEVDSTGDLQLQEEFQSTFVDNVSQDVDGDGPNLEKPLELAMMVVECQNPTIISHENKDKMNTKNKRKPLNVCSIVEEEFLKDNKSEQVIKVKRKIKKLRISYNVEINSCEEVKEPVIETKSNNENSIENSNKMENGIEVQVMEEENETNSNNDMEIASEEKISTDSGISQGKNKKFKVRTIELTETSETEASTVATKSVSSINVISTDKEELLMDTSFSSEKKAKRKSSFGSKYYCLLCEKHYSTAFNLNKHKQSTYHKMKEAEQETRDGKVPNGDNTSIDDVTSPLEGEDVGAIVDSGISSVPANSDQMECTSSTDSVPNNEKITSDPVLKPKLVKNIKNVLINEISCKKKKEKMEIVSKEEFKKLNASAETVCSSSTISLSCNKVVNIDTDSQNDIEEIIKDAVVLDKPEEGNPMLGISSIGNESQENKIQDEQESVVQAEKSSPDSVSKPISGDLTEVPLRWPLGEESMPLALLTEESTPINTAFVDNYEAFSSELDTQFSSVAPLPLEIGCLTWEQMQVKEPTLALPTEQTTWTTNVQDKENSWPSELGGKDSNWSEQQLQQQAPIPVPPQTKDVNWESEHQTEGETGAWTDLQKIPESNWTPQEIKHNTINWSEHDQSKPWPNEQQILKDSTWPNQSNITSASSWPNQAENGAEWPVQEGWIGEPPRTCDGSNWLWPQESSGTEWAPQQSQSGVAETQWPVHPEGAQYYNQVVESSTSLGSIMDSVNQVLDRDVIAPPPAPLIPEYALPEYSQYACNEDLVASVPTPSTLPSSLRELQKAMGATDEEMAILQKLGEGTLDPDWPLENAEIMDLDQQPSGTPVPSEEVSEESTKEKKSDGVVLEKTPPANNPPVKKRNLPLQMVLGRHSRIKDNSPSRDLSLLHEYQDKEMVCPLCHRFFLGLTALQTHVSSTHNREPVGKTPRPTNRPRKSLSSLLSSIPNEQAAASPRVLCGICRELLQDEAALTRHREELHNQPTSRELDTKIRPRRDDTAKTTTEGGGSEDPAAEGLKIQMSTALGDLFDRALSNLLEKGRLSGSGKDATSLNQLSLLQMTIKRSVAMDRKVADQDPQPSTSSSALKYNTALAKKVRRELVGRRSSSASERGEDGKATEPVLERPFACPICDDRFLILSTRNRHIARAHNNRLTSVEEQNTVSSPTSARASTEDPTDEAVLDELDGWREASLADWSVEPTEGDAETGSFLCSDCGINFETPQDVLQHRKLEHSTQSQMQTANENSKNKNQTREAAQKERTPNQNLIQSIKLTDKVKEKIVNSKTDKVNKQVCVNSKDVKKGASNKVQSKNNASEVVSTRKDSSASKIVPTKKDDSLIVSSESFSKKVVGKVSRSKKTSQKMTKVNRESDLVRNKSTTEIPEDRDLDSAEASNKNDETSAADEDVACIKKGDGVSSDNTTDASELPSATSSDKNKFSVLESKAEICEKAAEDLTSGSDVSTGSSKTSLNLDKDVIPVKEAGSAKTGAKVAGVGKLARGKLNSKSLEKQLELCEDGTTIRAKAEAALRELNSRKGRSNATPGSKWGLKFTVSDSPKERISKKEGEGVLAEYPKKPATSDRFNFPLVRKLPVGTSRFASLAEKKKKISAVVPVNIKKILPMETGSELPGIIVDTERPKPIVTVEGDKSAFDVYEFEDEDSAPSSDIGFRSLHRQPDDKSKEIDEKIENEGSESESEMHNHIEDPTHLEIVEHESKKIEKDSPEHKKKSIVEISTNEVSKILNESNRLPSVDIDDSSPVIVDKNVISEEDEEEEESYKEHKKTEKKESKNEKTKESSKHKKSKKSSHNKTRRQSCVDEYLFGEGRMLSSEEYSERVPLINDNFYQNDQNSDEEIDTVIKKSKKERGKKEHKRRKSSHKKSEKHGNNVITESSQKRKCERESDSKKQNKLKKMSEMSPKKQHTTTALNGNDKDSLQDGDNISRKESKKHTKKRRLLSDNSSDDIDNITTKESTRRTSKHEHVKKRHKKRKQRSFESDMSVSDFTERHRLKYDSDDDSFTVSAKEVRAKRRHFDDDDDDDDTANCSSDKGEESSEQTKKAAARRRRTKSDLLISVFAKSKRTSIMNNSVSRSRSYVSIPSRNNEQNLSSSDESDIHNEHIAPRLVKHKSRTVSSSEVL